MKCWRMAGSIALGLVAGSAVTELKAQNAAPGALPPLPTYAQPYGVRETQTPPVQRVAYQPTAAVPAPPVPSPTIPNTAVPAPPTLPGANLPPPPTTPGATLPPPPTVPSAPAAPVPPSPENVGREPLSTNRDLSLPAAEREGSGGEPTEAAAAAEEAKAPAKDPTKLLMNVLGLEESPVKVYGWLQNSYTGNTNGVPKNGMNFGVNPNNLANQWMGNQYYIIVENTLEQGDKVNFGFRVDNMFGNDWQFNHSHGLADTVAKANHFNGWDLPQAYIEMHLPPVISKGGTDIKGGKFYTIHGYEVVPATGRPLLSVPYMFNYGQPFTHVGVMATTHVTDRLNWMNAAVNGWDRWFNETYKWNYMTGINWTSKDTKANLAVAYIVGPDQYPTFLPANTVVYPTGIAPQGFMSGRKNPLYAGNWRSLFTEVFTYKWTDKFTQVMETDQGSEPNVAGWGPGGTPANAAWYSFGNWFLWQVHKKEDRDILTAVWRSEWFRDVNGIRTGTGKTDNYYEFTLGLIWKPLPYLWIRPEARYDWAQWNKPYNDGTRGSQFTLGVDAILLY
jgi:Putative beta-barrel porin-2, OmpL-like. bbp2